MAVRLNEDKEIVESIRKGLKEKDGYYVFIAEKRSVRKPKKEKPKQTLSKKLQRKYGNKAAGKH